MFAFNLLAKRAITSYPKYVAMNKKTSLLMARPLLHSLRADGGVRWIHPYECDIIGNREIVGYGTNGSPEYFDRTDYPFPAIRWKETTPELCTLREKEKGDWKCLTICDKKELYRWSFRHTYAEVLCKPRYWKHAIGCALILMNLAVWYWYVFYYRLLYRLNPLPESFSEECRAAVFRRCLDMENNPITGLASEWDYEKDDWKPGYGPKS